MKCQSEPPSRVSLALIDLISPSTLSASNFIEVAFFWHDTDLRFGWLVCFKITLCRCAVEWEIFSLFFCVFVSTLELTHFCCSPLLTFSIAESFRWGIIRIASIRGKWNSSRFNHPNFRKLFCSRGSIRPARSGVRVTRVLISISLYPKTDS